MIKLKTILQENSKPTLITEGMDEVNAQFDKLNVLKNTIESQYKEYQNGVKEYDKLISGLLVFELDALKTGINKAFTGKFTIKSIDYGFEVTYIGIKDDPKEDYYIFKSDKDGFGKEILTIKRKIEAELSGAKVNVEELDQIWGHRPSTMPKWDDDVLLGSMRVTLTKGYRDTLMKTKRPPTINIRN